jgi:hypothetical protein
MPFEITPEPYVPPGTPVEPENGTGFAITPEPYVPPGTPVEPLNTTSFAVEGEDVSTRAATPPSFIQWLTGGYPLGGPDVLVIDFRYPLIATRGVGKNENVITVRRAHPVGSEDIAQITVPMLVSGELIEPPSLFYTSILYPFITEDGMSLAVPVPQRSNLITVDADGASVAAPSLQSGTLVVTISFLTYDNSLLFPDAAQVFVPALESGTLVASISFVTYDGRPFPDQAQVPVPALESGTLIVTITFVNYTNPLLYPDQAQVPVPTLQSGTLV